MSVSRSRRFSSSKCRFRFVARSMGWPSSCQSLMASSEADIGPPELLASAGLVAVLAKVAWLLSDLAAAARDKAKEGGGAL
eukprot:CAMPEP_0115162186 /NCGR_PEP_ID=MMETSP0227-20121206/71809_1 /TAXON_ID=89957 /ORGANISM="Polarella glacialis, Strain CCMP 1383" /LENGTH=80 /DNA_ID=CAMNT_0002574343 /DNA_START=23 /DNA_END=262 /DNA_ORIENTATION=-